MCIDGMSAIARRERIVLPLIPVGEYTQEAYDMRLYWTGVWVTLGHLEYLCIHGMGCIELDIVSLLPCLPHPLASPRIREFRIP